MKTPQGGSASSPSPRKKLPVNPSLEHLQKQAKRRAKHDQSLQLASAQHLIAQEYGCKNWAELAKMVEVMSNRMDLASGNTKDFEPLPKAVKDGEIDTVRQILSRGTFTQHDLDQSLSQSLWFGEEAGWLQRKEIADLLLEHGADPDGQYGSGGYGPIVFGTCECLQPEGLSYLIEAGADVTFAPVPTKYGMASPLSHALGTYVRGRNARKHQTIDILLQHGAYIPPEVTPPILAIHRGDAETLAKLLDADHELISRRFPDMPYGNISLRGATLLHCAVEFGEIECLEELLKRYADLNARADIIDGVGGQTPIFHAINTNNDGNFSTLEYLVKRVGPVLDMTVSATWTSYGEAQAKPMTPLQYAESADTAESRKWRTRIDEELVLLRSLDQGAALKAALLEEDAIAVSRLLDAHPALLTPALWPIAIFQAKSLAMTRLLLDRGLNPDECSAPRKPLHLAVYQYLPDIVELLIARGANVHLRNPLGETPLELVDAYEPRPVGDPDSVRIRQALLQAGAKDDLFTLVRAGETDLIRQLLQDDPRQIETKTDGCTALYFAARSGRVEVARVLLEFGAAPDPANDVANTPLWFAAQSPSRPASHRIAIMKMLLAAGADINRRCEDGSTALHFAAWRGPVEAVEFLLSQGAKSWVVDTNEKGPVDYARMAEESPDKDAIIKLFTETRILDPLFRSAVEAIDAGDVNGLKAMLEKHPALLHQRAEEEGWYAGTYFRHPTLLHFVANNPYRHPSMPPRILETTEVLLAAGADINALTEADNAHTVLGLVTSCEPARKDGLQIPLIELLVRHGADPTSGLDPAIVHGESEAAQRLLQLGARPTLQSAAAAEDLDALRQLLQPMPAEPQRMDAASTAAQYGKIRSVETLLATGLDINRRIDLHPYAPTLLHHAAMFNHRALAEWLLDHGADPTLRDIQHNGTPAGWAQYGGGHLELAEWLREKESADLASHKGTKEEG